MPTVPALACILSVISAATRPGFTNPADFSATLRGVALPPTPMFARDFGCSIPLRVRTSNPYCFSAFLRQLRLALFFFLCIGGGVGYVFKSEEKKGGVISKNSKNKICAVALRQHNRDPTGRHRLRGEWSADGLRVGGGGHGFAVRKNLLGAVCMLEVDISESEGL